jgi:transposase
MSPQFPVPKRFIGLDLHKYYLIAVGVDTDLNVVMPPHRVDLVDLDSWSQARINHNDAIVLEMTTNTWQVYDELSLLAGSVTIVHPPHVALITRSQVMTDRIAALTLARLHAKGLLVGVWVPPDEVRQLRTLVAQRNKMTRLSTQAKNRLHAVLHRHHFPLPEGSLFDLEQNDWWLSLPIGSLEQVVLSCHLQTLRFARAQLLILEDCMKDIASRDPRIPFLIQLPGISIVSAITLLAAIGDISRFPDAKNLVGYAGLGSRIHDSGLTTRTGRITKAGRKDIRTCMVEAAHTAANSHPHWKAVLKRMEPHLGRNKTIVAIARKLLVAVWHVLTFQVADRFAEPEFVARKFLQFSYHLGVSRRSLDLSCAAFVRFQLDRLQLGQELTHLSWGVKKKPIPLPPSSLKVIAA